MVSQQTIRRVVWTGSIAAVTVMGTWYGAGLKMKSQHQREIQRRREASPAEKIAQLEETRGALIAKRIGLEDKIRRLEMRADGATREESMVGRERRR